MKNLHKTCGFILLLVGLSARAADDDSLLMLAGQFNHMRAIESRCEGIVPGYSAKFRTAYSAAKENLFDKAGLTTEILAKANAIPELSTAATVEKFDRQDLATKKQYCDQALQTLSDAAQAKTDAPQ